MSAEGGGVSVERVGGVDRRGRSLVRKGGVECERGGGGD